MIALVQPGDDRGSNPTVAPETSPQQPQGSLTGSYLDCLHMDNILQVSKLLYAYFLRQAQYQGTQVSAESSSGVRLPGCVSCHCASDAWEWQMCQPGVVLCGLSEAFCVTCLVE